jgi:hypothetical protein
VAGHTYDVASVQIVAGTVGSDVVGFVQASGR